LDVPHDSFLEQLSNQSESRRRVQRVDLEKENVVAAAAAGDRVLCSPNTYDVPCWGGSTLI
jgi:hypothetical protein